MGMTPSGTVFLEEALSLERFGRYVVWAGGDRQRAIEFYTLNTQLSECLYTPLQMLEVALRNRIHAVASAAVHDRWFDEPGFQKGSRQAEQLAKAKQDLADEGKAVDPGRFVAAPRAVDMPLLGFVRKAMKPERFVRTLERFEPMRGLGG